MKKETPLKLKPLKFALAAGIIVAVAVFATTLIAIITPYSTSIISNLYGSVGYSASITGAFLGALYGFIDTFILAFIFAWLYNKLI